MAVQPSVIWINQVLDAGIQRNVSDFHFVFAPDGSQVDASGGTLTLRWRVNGDLVHVTQIEGQSAKQVLNKLKVGSSVDSGKTQRPDDGRYEHRFGSGALSPDLDDDAYADEVAKLPRLDLRFVIMPTVNGEKIVLRSWPATGRLDLGELGASPENLKRIEDLLGFANGLVLFAGPVGSGKSLGLTTKVPTPYGYTTIGALAIGDVVLGRDGRPCHVTDMSPIDEAPVLYRLTFSDGQTIDADIGHQWLVSTAHQRAVGQTRKRRAAIERHESAHQLAGAIDLLSLGYTTDEWARKEVLHELLSNHDLCGEWGSPEAIYQALYMADCRGRETVLERPAMVTAYTRTERAKVYPLKPMLQEYVKAGGRRSPETRERAATLLREGTHPKVATTDQIATLVGVDRRAPYRLVKQLGLAGEIIDVQRDFSFDSQRGSAVIEFPIAEALRHLARRVREQHSHEPTTDVAMQRMSTGEMLAAGLRFGDKKQTQFAVPVTAALDLPDAELAIPPYTLGAWLGDGSTNSGGLTGLDPEIWAEVESDGFEITHNKRVAKSHYIKGLVPHLRAIGAFGDKRIPITYLRASIAQRLAVLQGLMDTDGTISKSGSCELTLSKQDLALDALELIRSLGIKASMTSGPSALTEDDPDNPGHKRRRVVGMRYRIKFTTDLPVFRLPRKLARLPEAGRARRTNEWLYIESIERIPSEPARCISVDSPDHTYLCGGGFVVTSNTTSMYAALEFLGGSTKAVYSVEDPVEQLLPGVDQIEVNPGAGRDFGDVLRALRRSDVQVLMIGEIRDKATAHAAVQIGVAGAKVISSIHANDSIAAIEAMLNLNPDLNPAQVMQSLRGVVSQRLVKLAHQDCSGTGALPDGQACEACGGTGVAGRAPIHEVLIVDDALVAAVVRNRPRPQLKAIAANAGMRPLRADAERLLIEGRTTTAFINDVLGAYDINEDRAEVDDDLLVDDLEVRTPPAAAPAPGVEPLPSGPRALPQDDTDEADVADVAVG